MKAEPIFTPKASAESLSPQDAITPEEAAAGARMAVRLFDSWGVSDAQATVLLGGVSMRSFARWKQNEIGRIEADRAMRLSLLAGIHKGLRMLFRAPSDAARWLRHPNPDFGGSSPLDILLQGRMVDLMDVRSYLDAARG